MVSIIVPVFNIEEYVSDALESLLVQTYKDIEIIVVNDGSTDRTLEICESFANLDKRVKVFTIQNAGVSAARNHGLDKACGEHIVFIDGDDIVSNRYIEILDAGLLNNIASIGSLERFFQRSPRFENGEPIYIDIPVREAVIKMLQGNFTISACGIMFVSKLIKEQRFDETIHYNEDKLFVFNYFINNIEGKVATTNTKIYGYRARNNSASSHKWNGNCDIIIVADLMEKSVKQRINSLHSLAIDNTIIARLTTIKWANRSREIKLYPEEIRTIRNELLTRSYSGTCGNKVSLELALLNIGLPIYQLLDNIYCIFRKLQNGKRG